MAERALIVGSDGRAEAVAWQLEREGVDVTCAPGSYGSARFSRRVNIGVTEIEKLARFAHDQKFTFTFVSPEAPLALGIGDIFAQDNLPILATGTKQARLEIRKSEAAAFMHDHGVPTGRTFIFERSETDMAKKYASQLGKDYVYKADGLAAGKGVIVAETTEEAVEAVNDIFVKNKFGEAGDKLVMQERLYGLEASVIAFCDGERAVPMPPWGDYKRVFDYDKGPNTGGMGTFGPVGYVGQKMMGVIQKEILDKTMKGMREEGTPYKGILYAGLMITKEGPKVLEFNCRMGDPETEAQMLLLKRGSLTTAIMESISGELEESDVEIRPMVAACVVLAAPGYPENPQKGVPVLGLDKEYKRVNIFLPGVEENNEEIVTSGGRSVVIAASGKSVFGVRNTLYDVIKPDKLWIPGGRYRKDIGLGREV